MGWHVGYTFPMSHEFSEWKFISQDRYQGSSKLFFQNIRVNVVEAGDFYMSFQGRHMISPRLARARTLVGNFLGLQEDNTYIEIKNNQLQFSHRAEADGNKAILVSDNPSPLRVSAVTNEGSVVQRRGQI